ncbi:hypothetical protein SCH4B_0066 [Ruegeria sp. TrichCH4B]|nr:hypothetical protein SCH4B_0066 [Ruegeria sp. TrichCH4B]
MTFRAHDREACGSHLHIATTASQVDILVHVSVSRYPAVMHSF